MKKNRPPNDLQMNARIRVKSAPVDVAAATDMDQRKGVQSVDIAFSVLRALEAAEGSLSLQKLAIATGQQPSKVHHYLVSLIRNGIVVQNGAGHYDLGPFALQLGLSALSRQDAIEQSTQAVISFRDETGEAAFLAVWGNRGPTIVRYVEGVHPVTVEVRAGLVLPVLSSATGRVFLTWLPEAKWSAIARWEIENGDHGLGRAPAKEIAAIRERTRGQGFGTIDGDLLPRIAAVSVPVFGQDGALICALTTLGWRGELSLSSSSRTTVRLVAISRALSRALGFRGEAHQTLT